MLVTLLAIVLTCWSPQPRAAMPAAGFVTNLRSSDTSVWREASLQVAHLGAAALPALEEEAKKGDTSLAPRLVETVEIMLVRNTTPDQLKSSVELEKLCEPDFEKGFVVARKLEALKSYVAEYGLRPRNAPPPDPDGPLELVGRLAQMGGAGVPAVASLLRNDSAATKLYGVAVALAIGATSLRGSLDSLGKSEQEIEVCGGCYSERVRVGKYVSRLMDSNAYFSERGELTPIDECERSLFSSRLEPDKKRELIDRLWNAPAAKDAKTWEEFWKSARATFRQVVDDLPRPAPARLR